MLRPLQTSSSHEDLFIERYSWLLSIALRLTNDRGLAEDLVHDAFIHFAFTHTDPNSIQNLEGYFYAMLRNLYLSEERSPCIKIKKGGEVAGFQWVRGRPFE